MRFRFLVWALFLLATARILAVAFLLEPITDEGLWLWNARCVVLDLPTGGILHAALSPANHMINLALFSYFGPDLLVVRLFNVALLIGVVASFWYFRRDQQSLVAVLAALFFLLVDPFLFRAASWATLETKVVAGMLIVYMLNQARLSETGQGVAWGVLCGTLVSIKATVLWLVPGISLYFLLGRKYRQLLFFVVTLIIVTGVLFGYVFLTSDATRFREVWQYHLGDKFGPGQGLLIVQKRGDIRSFVYLGILLGYWLVAGVSGRWKQVPHNPLSICVAFGTLMLLAQAHLYARYALPLAFLAVLDVARQFGPRVRNALTTRMVAGGLVVVLFVNSLFAYYFVLNSKAEGGRYLTELLQESISAGENVAAPPHLSVSLHAPVQPTSVGVHVSGRIYDGYPDLYIYQSVAAGSSFVDSSYQRYFEESSTSPVQIGFYQVFRPVD